MDRNEAEDVHKPLSSLEARYILEGSRHEIGVSDGVNLDRAELATCWFSCGGLEPFNHGIESTLVAVSDDVRYESQRARFSGGCLEGVTVNSRHNGEPSPDVTVAGEQRGIC